MPTLAPKGADTKSPKTTLARFLDDCHAELLPDASGALADYIPELAKVDPDRFGLCVATIDGFVHESGDSQAPFTIQSVSKALVYAMALEQAGEERVRATVGVEPSGEAFNSIRLGPDNRPYNPMINAGAIACSGLIHQLHGDAAFSAICSTLGEFAGRNLDVDHAVHQSETETGDRNRAIAYLLKNNGIVRGDVDAVLDVYFGQCSVLVTARDLAVMGSTLANGGLNPVTGTRVVSAATAASTLSVMMTSGMYDFAGEWIYRVGLPAKSGVGGGILACLPAQVGLGAFSPRLDKVGNSVRGIRACEALSSHFGLHVMKRRGDVRSAIAADYDVRSVASRRERPTRDRDILEKHGGNARILELAGALNFAAADYIDRRLITSIGRHGFVVIDVRRIASLSHAGAMLLGGTIADLAAKGIVVVLSGVAQEGPLWAELVEAVEIGGIAPGHRFRLRDQALEWVEDQLIFQHGGFTDLKGLAPLEDQDLLAGLDAHAIALVRDACVPHTFAAGETIITAGTPAQQLDFLQAGMVSVTVAGGIQVGSMLPGMAFGEMALLGGTRSANVIADTAVTCLELSLEAHGALERAHPQVTGRILYNLCGLLARRLAQANRKIEALGSN
jgi:glutaminase